MIRHVRKDDLQSIIEIRKAYLLDVDRLSDPYYRWQMQESGFIGSMTKIEFDRNIHHMFLVAEENGEIVGYLRIDMERDYQDNDKKIWLSEELKTSYFAEPHAELGMIGVRQSAKRKGIATALLNEAVMLLRKNSFPTLFSIIVVSPLTNFPSMQLHERLGFDRVAVSIPHHHFAMDHYQSILYRLSL